VSGARPRFLFAKPGSQDEILQDELCSSGILGDGLAENEAATLSAIQAEIIGLRTDVELAQKQRQGAGAVAIDQTSHQFRAAVEEAKCEELAQQMKIFDAALQAALQSQHASSSHENPPVQSSFPSSKCGSDEHKEEIPDHSNISATREIPPTAPDQLRPPTFSQQEFEQALHEADPDALQQALGQADSLRDQQRHQEAENIY